MQYNHPIIAYVNHFLAATKGLLKVLPLYQLPGGEEALAAFSVFKGVSTQLATVSDLNISTNDQVRLTIKSVKTLLLRQITAYNKGVKIIQGHQEELFFLYRYIGRLDMAVSTAAFRKSLPVYCTPATSDGLTLEGVDVYHPLLPKGAANTLTLTKPLLLTGSNASGKSTFLKTIGVNCLLAYSLYTCCAKSFTLPDIPLYSSMAIKDNVFKGESYFIAEIKSIKRILQAISKAPCLCLIDEILRGTNTIERIAASTAILQKIASTPCLCVIATHDIELTEIFKNSYHSSHFRETIQKGEVAFDYTLYPGPSKTKNAIELLDLLDIGPSITKKAKELAQAFEKDRQWPIAKKE